MKKLFIILAFLTCLASSFVSTRNSKGRIFFEDCKSIIDSAKILLQTSSFAVNLKPSINDHQRNLRLDKWLQKLPFKGYICLLGSGNASLEALGFIYGSVFHKDSLFNGYSYLLNDTTEVQIYLADGTVRPKTKLGKYLSEMTSHIKEFQEDFNKKPKIENIIAAFIKQYATYPESYKSIAFPEYSMGSDNKGLTDYKISNDYEIKNNQGKTVRVINVFVLDPDLHINVIEKDSTRISAAIPPKLEYWFKEFGRNINRNDSLKLRLIY